MIPILRKEGWELNPNDKILNGILRSIERNGGDCVCSNPSIDVHCPCSDYREKDICHCSLYIRKK